MLLRPGPTRCRYCCPTRLSRHSPVTLLLLLLPVRLLPAQKTLFFDINPLASYCRYLADAPVMTWKRRLFVLFESGALCYYLNENDRAKGAPRGVVTLTEDFFVSDAGSDRSVGIVEHHRIVLGDLDNTSCYLACTTKAEKDTWIAALAKVIQSQNITWVENPSPKAGPEPLASGGLTSEPEPVVTKKDSLTYSTSSSLSDRPSVCSPIGSPPPEPFPSATDTTTAGAETGDEGGPVDDRGDEQWHPPKVDSLSPSPSRAERTRMLAESGAKAKTNNSIGGTGAKTARTASGDALSIPPPHKKLALLPPPPIAYPELALDTPPAPPPAPVVECPVQQELPATAAPPPPPPVIDPPDSPVHRPTLSEYDWSSADEEDDGAGDDLALEEIRKSMTTLTVDDTRDSVVTVYAQSRESEQSRESDFDWSTGDEAGTNGALAKAIGVESGNAQGIAALWQARADTAHLKQAGNVFSGKYHGAVGKASSSSGSLAASLPAAAEWRAKAAKKWVDEQVELLVSTIYTAGGGDGSVTFGVLFEKYQSISDSVVGILMRARKRGRVTYVGDMLFQGQDDGTVIRVVPAGSADGR